MTSAHAPLLFAAIVFGACAGSHTPSVLRPEPDPCVLVAPPSSPAESVTVALSSGLAAERFVAAQAHETLLGVDCRGRLYPRLARAWYSEVVAGSQRWTITLAPDARFWNSDRVTANDVLLAWRSTGEPPAGALARLVAAATTVIDDRTLSVTLADSTPLILADPSLAVYRLHDNSQWREGTGSRVRVLSIDATAARDALDAGADLLVTDDPAIVSYAAHNADLLMLPLPWARTYVVRAAETPPPDASATRRLTLTELLADAVRSDTRIAQPPFWWESSDRCSAPVATNQVAPASRSTRVVYQSGDRVAQDLAERLVALAGSRQARAGDSVLTTLLPQLSQAGARATVGPLDASAFATALQAGDDLAYVLPLLRFAVAPCHEVAKLLRAAPWLQSAIPLIDTRSHAIVRRGRVGLAVNADGSLRLLDGAFPKHSKP